MDETEAQIEEREPPFDLELQYPIVVRSTSGEVLETITKLTVRRRPNAGDLMAADKAGDVGRALVILSRLTGQPMRIVEQLDVRGGEASDAQRALAIVGGFF